MAQRYTEEQKSAAADRCFERRSSRAVIEELGYPSTTALPERAHPDPRWDRPVREYRQRGLKEKPAAVSERLDGSMRLREAADGHGVDPAQISRRAKPYLKGGPEALRPKGGKGVLVSRRDDNVRPDSAPPPEQVPDEGPRDRCEQLKLGNDVLRAEPGLFAKKARASAKMRPRTPRRRS